MLTARRLCHGVHEGTARDVTRIISCVLGRAQQARVSDEEFLLSVFLSCISSSSSLSSFLLFHLYDCCFRQQGPRAKISGDREAETESSIRRPVVALFLRGAIDRTNTRHNRHGMNLKKHELAFVHDHASRLPSRSADSRAAPFRCASSRVIMRSRGKISMLKRDAYRGHEGGNGVRLSPPSFKWPRAGVAARDNDDACMLIYGTMLPFISFISLRRRPGNVRRISSHRGN